MAITLLFFNEKHQVWVEVFFAKLELFGISEKFCFFLFDSLYLGGWGNFFLTIDPQCKKHLAGVMLVLSC